MKIQINIEVTLTGGGRGGKNHFLEKYNLGFIDRVLNLEIYFKMKKCSKWDLTLIYKSILR